MRYKNDFNQNAIMLVNSMQYKNYLISLELHSEIFLKIYIYKTNINEKFQNSFWYTKKKFLLRSNVVLSSQLKSCKKGQFLIITIKVI
jgi:hypothetical protein